MYFLLPVVTYWTLLETFFVACYKISGRPPSCSLGYVNYLFALSLDNVWPAADFLSSLLDVDCTELAAGRRFTYCV